MGASLRWHDTLIKEFFMETTVQIVFYSMYGHVYKMAEAVAEGARLVDNVTVLYIKWPN